MAPDVPISLVTPSEEYVESFFEAMAEFRAEGLPQISDSVTRETFPAYVQSLHDLAMGVNLKEAYIPSREFWIVDSEGYAGRIILGLTYYPSPERVGIMSATRSGPVGGFADMRLWRWSCCCRRRGGWGSLG